MYGCPVTSTFGSPDRGHDPALLGARAPGGRRAHRRRRLRAGPEVADRAGEVVDAVQRLHHHALDAQVVAPDPFDQGGVVDALDPDPAGLGHLGAYAGDRHRAGRGALPAPAARASPPACAGSPTWPSSRNAAGSSGKLRRLPCRSSSTTAPNSNPTTAPQKPGVDVLDHQIPLGVDLRDHRAAPPVAREHVLPIHVPHVNSSRADTPVPTLRPRQRRRGGTYPCSHVPRSRCGDPHGAPVDPVRGLGTRLACRPRPVRRAGRRDRRRRGAPRRRCPRHLDRRAAGPARCPPSPSCIPDEIRLVLPAPGDPRGLPGPGELTGAALLAGEAVMTPAFGVVPEVRRHTSGSGVTFETVLLAVLPGRRNTDRSFQMGSAEAEAELARALTEATTQLTRLDVAHWRPELAGALAGAAPPGEHRHPAARLRPALAPAVRPGQRPRPGAGPGRAQRPRRRGQRLRGPAARRGPAPADDRLPSGAGRRVQCSPACLTAYAHCTLLRRPLPPGQPWPRRCGACGETSYLNPTPVAVAVQPVGDGLLVVRRGIPPARDRARPAGRLHRRGRELASRPRCASCARRPASRRTPTRYACTTRSAPRTAPCSSSDCSPRWRPPRTCLPVAAERRDPGLAGPGRPAAARLRPAHPSGRPVVRRGGVSPVSCGRPTRGSAGGRRYRSVRRRRGGCPRPRRGPRWPRC